MAGLQTQYAPSGYLGLWSRLAGFRRHALTDALLAAADRAGLGHARHHPHGLGAGTTGRSPRPSGPPAGTGGCAPRRPTAELDMPAAAAAVRGYLAERPAQAGRDPGPAGRRRLRPGGLAGRAAVAGPGAGAARPAPGARRGRTCTGWPSRRCRSRTRRRARRPAGRELVGRYLAAFGPASAGDVACVLRLERHGHPRGAGRARRCAGSATSGRRARRRAPTRPLPPADTPAPVRFLGQWDAVLLVHARRGQILPERTGRGCSPRRCRSRCRHSWSTARWPGPGATSTGEVAVRTVPRAGSGQPGASWTRRRSGWPPSTATADADPPGATCGRIQQCARSSFRCRSGRGRPGCGPGTRCRKE